MSASRVITSTHGKKKASFGRSREQRPSRANNVLAERNQTVVAVGAWVEDGQDFLEHPSALASLTEELQAARRRENEEGLRRFQDEVRHRVAQRAQVCNKRPQVETEPVVKPDRSITQKQYGVWAQPVAASERLMSAGGAIQKRLMDGRSQESSEGMRQVRLRLAACRMILHEGMMTDLPGGRWNICQTRHEAESLSTEQEEGEEVEVVQGEEDDDEGDEHVLTSQHECPLVQQKVSGHTLWGIDRPQPDPGIKSNLRVAQVLWPLPNQEELKRQRQSQFLMHRRQFMNTERKQVKENNQHRKHLKRTARIKAEKEQIRCQEERKLERVRMLTEARQKLEERELLILERLKLEEEERVMELQRRREEKGKVAASRFTEALKARMKERLSQEKLDLPPLCCCASSFWDSHPDTCANNCVFHNNPKAYAQALHSALLSLDLE
uniref:coiled-coil domain-containing protein 15 isoform X2 n=1 Tax=Monopterus albus TaxID=43700 RepID=UPI0009B39EA9|nr:coiled-coil domain-containing protein 15 isoform X2 [Monopterus albus]